MPTNEGRFGGEPGHRVIRVGARPEIPPSHPLFPYYCDRSIAQASFKARHQGDWKVFP